MLYRLFEEKNCHCMSFAFTQGDHDVRPLRSDRDVDLRPGQHQPLLHRRLHLRDAAQDVRPRQVLYLFNIL